MKNIKLIVKSDPKDINEDGSKKDEPKKESPKGREAWVSHDPWERGGINE